MVAVQFEHPNPELEMSDGADIPWEIISHIIYHSVIDWPSSFHVLSLLCRGSLKVTRPLVWGTLTVNRFHGMKRAPSMLTWFRKQRHLIPYVRALILYWDPAEEKELMRLLSLLSAVESYEIVGFDFETSTRIIRRMLSAHSVHLHHSIFHSEHLLTMLTRMPHLIRLVVNGGVSTVDSWNLQTQARDTILPAFKPYFVSPLKYIDLESSVPSIYSPFETIYFLGMCIPSSCFPFLSTLRISLPAHELTFLPDLFNNIGGTVTTLKWSLPERMSFSLLSRVLTYTNLEVLLMSLYRCLSPV